MKRGQTEEEEESEERDKPIRRRIKTNERIRMKKKESILRKENKRGLFFRDCGIWGQGVNVVDTSAIIEVVTLF